MSTRATYTFKTRFTGTTTFYIHHNGYERGAANLYFAPCFDRFGPDAFYRTNERAELTKNRDMHGDTEFHYEIEMDDEKPQDADLTVYARDYSGDDKWNKIFEGKVIDFINQHAEPENQHKKVKIGYFSERWLTKSNILNTLEKKKAHYKAYKKQHPTMAGNISSMESDIADYEQALQAWEK